MTEPSRAQRHLEMHRDRAAKAFANHVITKQSDRRWLLQRMHADGRPDWTMAGEVIALEGSAIYVGGDIDHVLFAYGPEDPIARLRWMGECKDLGYYVAQKARIGTGRELVDLWDEDVAREQLIEYLEDGAERVVDKGELDYALEAETREHFYDRACKALGCDAWEVVGHVGQVLAPRVIYAHAALARLCSLLRESSGK